MNNYPESADNNEVENTRKSGIGVSQLVAAGQVEEEAALPSTKPVPKVGKCKEICLASNEIVMGPTSELGPIDPSLNKVPSSILAEPEVAKTNFAMHKLAVFAIQQTQDLAHRLLTEGMMEGKPVEQVKEAVRLLSTKDKYTMHGAVIDHKEAAILGLNVKYLPEADTLWKRFWLLYSMYSHDTQLSGVVKVFEGRARSISVVPPQKVSEGGGQKGG